MVQRTVTVQENKEHTSQQQHCFRRNSGTPKTVAEPARPHAGRPTPWLYFWYQMNKARSSSSTEYIRDQQTLQHGIAITFILSSLVYLCCICGGSDQANSHSDSANGGIGFMGGLCSRATGSLLLLPAAGPLPPKPGKADPVGPGASHFCKTLTSLARVSRMTLQRARVRTYARYTNMFSLQCSATLLRMAKPHLTF